MFLAVFYPLQWQLPWLQTSSLSTMSSSMVFWSFLPYTFFVWPLFKKKMFNHKTYIWWYFYVITLYHDFSHFRSQALIFFSPLTLPQLSFYNRSMGHINAILWFLHSYMISYSPLNKMQGLYNRNFDSFYSLISRPPLSPSLQHHHDLYHCNPKHMRLIHFSVFSLGCPFSFSLPGQRGLGLQCLQVSLSVKSFLSSCQDNCSALQW